jgi:glycosyltransferase involved in cell wall biosynthesis
MDARKELDVLVRAFERALGRIPSIMNLVLIGNGNEEGRLRSLVAELSLQNRVVFAGRINDPNALKAWYVRALFSVSYGQAGLSVLQSLAFGVPFLTKKNAISGGEKTNIIDGYNGLLCEDSPKALEEAIVRLCSEPEKTRDMGRSAYAYYSENCTMDNMVAGFQAAIEGRKPA